LAKSPKSKLDYMAEYQRRPGNVKKRVQRNAARRLMIRNGRASVGDGKDVDHRDTNTQNNSPSNLRIQSRKENRRRGR